MRILVVASSYPYPGHIFSGIFNEKCVKALTSLGNDVEVIAPRPFVPPFLSFMPHWKEYSRGELRKYFKTLSRDFSVSKQKYISCRDEGGTLNWKGKLAYDKRNLIPLFREGIYLEIELIEKNLPITLQPKW